MTMPTIPGSENVQMWGSTHEPYQFMIGFDHNNKGLHGFVASWTNINIKRPMVVLPSSPYQSLKQAKMGCEEYLEKLLGEPV